jgi:amino acid transporter
MIKEPLVKDYEQCSNQTYRVCWGAIIAGALVGLGLGFLLNLYATAISLSAFSSTTQGAYVIAMGGLIGMLIGVIVTTAASGFVAGYLGRYHYYPLSGGVLYGFITWSLVIFLSALLIGPMGRFVDDYKNNLTHTPTVTTSDARGMDTTRTTQENSRDNNKVTVTPTQLAWGGWLTFVLFFIGALSSCIGACCGIRCIHCTRDVTPVTRVQP